MNALRTLLLAGSFAILPLAAPAFAADGIAIAGQVNWTHADGRVHPATHAPVGIYDDRSGQLLAEAETDMTGAWSLELPAAAGEAVAVYARADCRWRSGQIKGTTGPVHSVRSAAITLKPGDHAALGILAGNEKDSDTCFSVREALSRMADYYAALKDDAPTFLRVSFPTDRYTSMFSGNRLHILQLDRWDWDVVMHEYGHFVAAEHNLDLSPGGDHSSAVNLSEYKDENGEIYGKDRGIRLAWSEGLATYLAISAQDALGMRRLGIPNVGDARYSDTEDISLSMSMKSSVGSLGEDNELTVTRVLYDLYDGANVREHDDMALGDEAVWSLLVTAEPHTLSDAISAFQDGQPIGQQMKIGAIASRHGVAPKLLPPVRASSDVPATFAWTQSGSPDFGNNRFVVRFFDSAMNVLFETKVTTGTSFTPTPEQWLILTSASTPVSWAVTARSVAEPATGPYVSGLQMVMW